MKNWIVLFSWVIQLVLVGVKLFNEKDQKKFKQYQTHMEDLTNAAKETNKSIRNRAILRVLSDYKQLRQKNT